MLSEHNLHVLFLYIKEIEGFWCKFSRNKANRKPGEKSHSLFVMLNEVKHLLNEILRYTQYDKRE